MSFVFGLVYGAGRLSATLSLNFSGRLYDMFHFVNDRNTRLGSTPDLAVCSCLGFYSVLLV